jgi:ribulose-5-phosphate 4-epimerase/fuculose-1-phosphate aldolase
MGLFLGHEVPWFDTSTTVTTAEHADRLADQLGGEKAVLMRGFGAVTVGTSVAEAVARAWLLERAAATVVTAAAIATPLAFPASAAAPFESRDGPATAQLHRTWNYLRHKWTSAATTTTEILRT